MRTAKIFLYSLVAVSMVFYTLAVALLASPLTASAAQTIGLPSAIGYQGRLKTAAGLAVSDAARTFTFQFCADAATTAACAEPLGAVISQSLTTANGYFSTSLSTTGVSSYFAVGNLYLQVTVSGEILNPTVQVFASPYSMTTRAVEQLPVASEPATGGQTGYAGRIYYDTTNNLLKYYDAGAVAWVAAAGTLNGATLTLDNSAATTVNIGTSAVARAVTVGSTTTTASTTIRSGTGDVTVTSTDDLVMTITDAITIDGAEFDVSGTTGAITINDGGDAGALTVEGSVLDINSLDFVAAGTVTSAAGSALNITSGTTGAVTLDSGSTGAVNVGTGAAAKVVSVGNLTGASSLALNGGTGGIALLTGTTGAVSIASGTTGAVSLDSGTTGAVNVGTGSNAKTVTVGNSTTTSALNLLSGSGDMLLDADAVTGSDISLDAYDATNNTTGIVTLDGAAVQINTFGSIAGLGNAGFDVNVGSSGTLSLATTNGAVSLSGGGASGSIDLTSAQSSISIDTQTASTSISIGTSNVTRTINLGTGTGADTFNIGAGADLFNFVSTSAGSDSFNFSAANTTSDAFDVDATSLTTGDVFDITYAGTTGAAIRVTDASSDDANDMVFLNNTDATVTAQTYLIRGQYADTGDANADFLLFEDAGGTDQFVVGQDGDVTITGVAEGTAALTLTTGDITVSDGDVTVSAGDFAVSAGSVGVTGDDTTNDVFGINGNTLTTGQALVLTYDASTHLSGNVFEISDNDAGVDFAVAEDGATTITGSAEGTAALTLTAGDLVITDGDFSIAGGELLIGNGTVGAPALAFSSDQDTGIYRIG
ncbi:MAG: hypothetical protein AAB431_00555, partial [Patescibacteria group bacterium]